MVYNSQEGNSLAGYGWNLSGLSAITRIPATTFHDGIIDGVDFDDLDRYALDGQRLILKSGTYGQPGAEYLTENSFNLRIFSKSIGAYSGIYFEVWYPNGGKAFYGNVSGAFTPYGYMMTKYQNSDDLVITYNYSTSGNISVIQSIYYGGKNEATQPNAITFQYGHRRCQRSKLYGQYISHSG